MDRQEVIMVLESLTNALVTATSLLREAPAAARSRGRGKTILTSAGMPWSAEEDARVCQEHDAGMTVAQIALQHGRSSGAITSRLVKLGKIDPGTVKLREPPVSSRA